jgi:hypothetical protein
MIEVFDKTTLETLCQNTSYPRTFCLFIKNRLKELQQALLDAGEEEQDTQSLKDYGFMIILEVIFSNCDYYWISVAYTNSFLMEFFIPDLPWCRNIIELKHFLKRWDCQDKKVCYKKAATKRAA